MDERRRPLLARSLAFASAIARALARALAFALAVALAVAGTTGERAAQAQPAGGGVAVTYQAPEGTCPGESELLARVRARAPDAPRTPRRFAVTIARDGERFVGRVSAPPAVERAVSAASCAELVDALALVIVFAVEQPPNAAGPPPATPPPAPSPEPATASVAQPPPPVRVALGAHGGVASAIAPITAPFVAVHVDVGPLARFGPSLRAGGRYARSASVDGPSGAQAAFASATAFVEGCPLRLPAPGATSAATSTLGLVPCAVLRGGVLTGVGSGFATAQSASTPWLDAAVAARLEALLGARIRLEIEGQVLFPFTRKRFLFDPDQVVFSVPAVGVSGEAGLSMSIW